MTRRVRTSVVSFLVYSIGLLTACKSDPGTNAEAMVGPEVCEVPVVLAALPDELFEVSGIIRDPRLQDLFWVHNDSGNDPAIYGINLSGEIVAVVPIAGASNRDVEDIAIGPCPDGDCLYLADIGDNLAVHASVVIQRLPLPGLPASAGAEIIDYSPIEPNATWRLVYEDGPRDSESLVVDAERSELVVVSKGRNNEIVLYAIPLADLHDGLVETDTLRRIGRLRLPIGTSTSQFVTAADLSPDASTLGVRSYSTFYEFAWEGSATFDTATVPGWASLFYAREAQGEGLSWDRSGETVLLVSEGRGGTPPSLSRMGCPAGESSTK
ncbi:MAG: hypothetical protein E4H28_02985 [Gemmatimonadales bacterium]|nr:MAG: hypothetical protein E4H28_02985 [Gemmatimonadales bacterium]